VVGVAYARAAQTSSNTVKSPSKKAAMKAVRPALEISSLSSKLNTCLPVAMSTGAPVPVLMMTSPMIVSVEEETETQFEPS
jgi:hypothetical protein